jgi:hypothetical protein
MGVSGGARSKLALCLLVACCNSFAGNLVLIGPIERVANSGKELTVLGQLVTLAPSTRTSGVPEIVSVISQDQLVLVSAVLQPDGRYAAKELQTLPARYVPGASEVFIRGVISSVDAQTAKLELNGLSVYFGDLVNAPSLRLREGEHISVVGKQPIPLGSIWASEIETAESDRPPESLWTSIAENYTDTQDQSIGGTGVRQQSITGTGVRLQSITGTGVRQQSITGTGVRLQSITGTGVRQQSITGTGVRLQSITGTGVRQQSITGTGVRLQSITGTGVRQQSITGTGVRLQSITGTGVRQQSITGTGVRLQSITGTGVRQQSITGTGVRLQSITGTGVRQQGITGTGVRLQSITGTGVRQ